MLTGSKEKLRPTAGGLFNVLCLFSFPVVLRAFYPEKPLLCQHHRCRGNQAVPGAVAGQAGAGGRRLLGGRAPAAGSLSSSANSVVPCGLWRRSQLWRGAVLCRASEGCATRPSTRGSSPRPATSRLKSPATLGQLCARSWASRLSSSGQRRRPPVPTLPCS